LDDSRRRVWALSLAFLLTAGAATVLGEYPQKNGGPCPPPIGADTLANSPIHHVFFLVKENHAFENYFGDRPGVRGYPPNGSFPVAPGSSQTVSPFELTTNGTPDLPHSNAAALASLDGGKLDGFVAEATALGAPAPLDAVGYFPPTTIAPYPAYADHYALADRFFAGVLGPTLPNRIFDLSASTGNWTSDAPPPPGTFTFPTVLDQLTSRGIPWAYDFAGAPSNLAPTLIPSLEGSSCDRSRIVPVSELPAQLNSSSAPAVTFIDPSNDPTVSEHPYDSVTVGASWSATVVNDILRSPVGPSSVIFLTFDESGGFWDPVPPPAHGSTGDGFRVPLLVLSAWTPSGAVLDAPLDPAALLRFVDVNWGLPFLNARVADAPGLAGFFDFGGPRTSPLIVPSNVSLGAGSPSVSTVGSSAPRAEPVPHGVGGLRPAARLTSAPFGTSEKGRAGGFARLAPRCRPPTDDGPHRRSGAGGARPRGHPRQARRWRGTLGVGGRGPRSPP
jgi:phospholipase C